MPRALLSVSDKTGLIDFAQGLATLGWDLISTGGTAQALRKAGVVVSDVAEVTGFPEMLDGRVKTLHPAVHGALLARRDDPSHMDAIAEHGITPIDLVAVNLYPFQRTAARRDASPAEVIEQIDIGGPSMLRSAAKNHASVTTVVDPADYPRVLQAIQGDDVGGLRRELAAKVFAHTAAYDAAIAAWFSAQDGARLPDRLCLPLEKSQALRYGENPAQAAAFYVERPGLGLASLVQRGGKALSFNNLLDLEGALITAEPFEGQIACAIIKHTTPCGLATGASPLEAYRKALACDPVSAFGSVIAFTTEVDDATANAVSSLFVECVVAPKFSDGAREILSRKQNLRVLEGTARYAERALDYKRVRGGLLVQERPVVRGETEAWTVASERQPTEAEREDLRFAWLAVASVKSNAIVLAREGATIGIGAGQMSRVDAAFMAVHKAQAAGHETAGAVLASDAFFPFADGIEQAAAAGVRAIVQPGGSVRDAEVIAAANAHDIAMIMTGERLFRH